MARTARAAGTTRDENEAVVRRIFDAFARRDGFALRGLFAEDAEWRVPGESAVAGTYRGREQIIRFLGRLPRETGGTYRARLVDVLASDERAAALYRASGERGGRVLDIEQVLLFRLEEGAVREVLALPGDPVAFDAFWAPASTG